MDKAILVGAGGFVGSILRYAVAGLAQSAFPASTFPYGTLVVNVTGCFVVGLVSQVIETHGALAAGHRAFVVVGVLGGYTTFSAFGNETVTLLRDGQPGAGGANILAHLVLALCAVWLGRVAAHAVWR